MASIYLLDQILVSIDIQYVSASILQFVESLKVWVLLSSVKPVHMQICWKEEKDKYG